MSRDQSVPIEYKGIEFTVHFDYQPEEKEVRYYANGDGYPGCPESVEITSIDYEGEEWIEVFTDKALEEIEQAVWDWREEY